MREMQPGLQQQRPGDARPGQRVPHRVFSLLCVQQAAAAGRRVLFAGRRAAVPGRPQPAAGEELRGKPHQPRTRPLQQTAAPGRSEQHCLILLPIIIISITFKELNKTDFTTY